MADWADDPTAKRWIRHVIKEMVPKMKDSTFVMELVPNDRRGDVKFWVELGAAIMMDKPIVAVAFNEKPIPRKLRLVADEIVICRGGVGPETSEQVGEALRRLANRMDL